MGPDTGSSSSPSTSSSTSALVAAPPPPSAPSTLGTPPPGPSGRGGRGGGGGRFRRWRGGRDGGGGRTRPGGRPDQQVGPPPLAPLPAPGGTPWPSFSNPWSGRISMWPLPGQGGGGSRPPLHSAALFSGAGPFAPTWLPPAQPSPSAWDPTVLAQSFSTMGLTPPTGPEWIADSGASYHTTPDAGILSSTRPPDSSSPSSIMVGDGSCLPVTSVGSAAGPFRLSNVLVAPQMVHNLLSIRQFTADNSCSVEFDNSGLTVKDLASRRPLLRCDSTGPLYTLRLPSSAAALAVTPSSTTWHRRLGHPGRDVLAQLSRSANLSCTRPNAEHFCHACQLGRHVRLPFSSSSSHATHIFALVHCDLWTSPVPSISGYKYYLVVLDDFSHYSWTFPLRAKSETFPTLLHFFT